MRIAQTADAPAISRLVNEAFGSERFFIDADRTSPEKVAALLQQGIFLLFFEDSAMTGAVYVEIRGERGYFGLLAVDPRRHGGGIGSRLIAAAEEPLPLLRMPVYGSRSRECA
jgi:predicted N-acetyltransferase YhbS